MPEQRHVRFATLGVLTKDELQLAVEVWFDDALKAPWASKETMKLAGVLRLYMMNPCADRLDLKMVEDIYQLNADSARRALGLFTLYGLVDSHSTDGNQLRAALRLSRLQTLRVLEARQRLAELSGADLPEANPTLIEPALHGWQPDTGSEVLIPATDTDLDAHAGLAVTQTAQPLAQVCEPQSDAPQSNTPSSGQVYAVPAACQVPEQRPSKPEPVTALSPGAIEACRTPAGKTQDDTQDAAAVELNSAVMRLRQIRQAAERSSRSTSAESWGRAELELEGAGNAAPSPEQDHSGQATLARSLARLRQRV